MVSPTPVRFPADVDRAVGEYARRGGTPKSTVVVRAVDEWLRMQAHPRIHFVMTNTGQRRAALLDGPQVWTVAEAWQQHEGPDRTATSVAHAVGLPTVAVEAALAYWAEHREEIDEILAVHMADADAALEAWERRQALDAL